LALEIFDELLLLVELGGEGQVLQAGGEAVFREEGRCVLEVGLDGLDFIEGP
jgi:hypothetical protein